MYDKEKFIQFLQDGYADWVVKKRREGGRISDTSQRAFCTFLDIPDTTFSRLLTGRRGDMTTTDKLARWYGPELYELSDMPGRMPKNPLLKSIAEKFHRLPEERQKYYADLVAKEVEEEEKKQAGKDHPDQQQMSLA